MLLALAVTLPFLLLTAGIVWKLAENERANRREAIAFSTRALLNTVDAMLSKHIAVAQTLSMSPALLADDLVEFRKEAERAQTDPSGGWIVVSDQDGQQIFNLIRPPGAPRCRIRHPASARTAAPRPSKPDRFRFPTFSSTRFRQMPIVTVEMPIHPTPASRRSASRSS